MHKYTIIHTRSTYTNVHRYVTSGNVYVTGYRITPVMQGQLSQMNDVYSKKSCAIFKIHHDELPRDYIIIKCPLFSHFTLILPNNIGNLK